MCLTYNYIIKNPDETISKYNSSSTRCNLRSLNSNLYRGIYQRLLYIHKCFKYLVVYKSSMCNQVSEIAPFSRIYPFSHSFVCLFIYFLFILFYKLTLCHNVIVHITFSYSLHLSSLFSTLLPGYARNYFSRHAKSRPLILIEDFTL